jgi:CRISPR-associated endoribonuclease Cas6/Csy4 subtype I-F
MEKPTHYVEARILPLDSEMPSSGDMAFVMSRIMTSVHLSIVEGAEIAVSFPKYRTKAKLDDKGVVVEPTGPGNVVRIFGDMMALVSFISRPDFAQLVGSAGCSIGKNPIKPVPEDVSWEKFSRNRSSERGTDGGVRRIVDRLARKVAQGTLDISPEEIEDRGRSIRAKGSKRMPPYVHLDSVSTQKRFRLFIDRSDVLAFDQGAPTSYGLGVAVPAF